MMVQKFWIIAWRDLGRNRRRTILSITAVALGLALLVVLSGYIAGVFGSSLQNSIRMNTGHVQIRAATFDESRLSLQWRDLVANPSAYVAQAEAMSQVKSATPILLASAILATASESDGIIVYGIDPAAPRYDFLRQGLVAGEYLSSDDKGQILLGKHLAESMRLGIGSRVSVAVGQADGAIDEGTFTIKGLFVTGVPSYDDSYLIMPLAQAQSFTGSGDRASAIVLTLQRQEDAAAVAAALKGANTVALTWEDLHQLLIQTIQTSIGYYILLFGIVILIVAVLVTNTLLMVVFERTREIGILAALGMKGRQILVLFQLEAAIMAIIGIAVGLLLGSGIVLYLGSAGIHLGDQISGSVQGIALGSVIYTRLVPSNVFYLVLSMLVIILLAALYPASYATRLEPVKALHAL